MPEMIFKRFAVIPAMLPVLVAVAACETGDAVVDVSGDHPILNFATAIRSPALPAGSAEMSLAIGGFDTSIPDAFGRATGALGRYVSIETNFGPAMGFETASAVRNASLDRRGPALVPSNAAGGEFWGLFNLGFTGQGPGAWDFYGSVTGLKPSTVYTVVFARMAVAVRGVPDHIARLLGDQEDQPDSLYYLGGAEAGYPDVTCNFTAFSPVAAADNPIALGTVKTDADGNVVVDCVPLATGDSPWWRSDASATPPGAADSVPFGVNGPGGSVRPGQYNYVLLVEGQGTDDNPVPDVNPTVRIQVGPDIDENGDAIDEMFAPFPTGTMDPTDARNAPGGANSFPIPGELEIQFRNLPNLASGTYQVFLTKGAGGQAVAANGSVTVGDGEPSTGSTFNPPSAGAVTTLVITEQSVGQPLQSFDRIVLSLESGGASSPSNEFLFFTYLDDRGTGSEADDILTTQGDLAFGTVEESGQFRPYAPGGTGQGHIYHDSLIVALRGITQPPKGWKYQAFLAVQDDGTIASDSDVLVADPVTPDADGRADVRIGGISLGSYNTFVLGLAPAIGASGRLTPFMIHVSDDYRAKFADFFGGGS